MKNFGKILAVILGFLIAVGILIYGCIKLVAWNAGVFLACLSIFAGLAFLYFIVSESKGIYGKATVGAWISGSMFIASYGILIPIWMFNLDSIWIAYLAVGLIVLGALMWLIGRIIQLKH